jgi:hypothetical protein
MISQDAKAGDIVYIHYSGHGARVKTSYPDLKGQNGLDEAIVPLDIGCGGQYLRDVEIAILLNAMTNNKLIVTVVLDCCHSGSITRSPGDPQPRGIEQIDALANDSHQRTAIQIPEDQPELMNSLKTTYRTVGREVWWDPRGYELFAACHLGKQAYEKCYQDGHWHGVLTYNLLASLKLGGANLTHGMLEQRLTAKVTQEQSLQTPIFAGNKCRYLFRSDERRHVPTIAVTRVDGKNVILAAGKVHAMLCGSEYAIYPWNANDFDDSDQRPKVRVIEVRSMESTAKLFELPLLDESDELSFQAVPLKSLVKELVVKLCSNSSDRIQRTKFTQLQDKIAQQRAGSSDNAPSCPVKLVSGSETAAYHIGVDQDKYKLLNTTNQPIVNFPSSTDPTAFLCSLKHLAKYEMIRNLKNSTVAANLRKNVKFELDVQCEAPKLT